MNPNLSCPNCGANLPPDAPAGLCPRCLMRRGLGSDTSGTTAGYSSFSPPAVSELVALFPQLEIIELLGAGGMGAVYKARQPGLDRLVALKILPRRDDAAFAERFTREARALAKLSHPGIVTVHDFGQAGGLYYFVMEFVEGVNLRQAERSGNLTPAEALAIVPQICAALQFAHDAGVVHRDIKPENILLDGKGRVKIADFGLAKLRGSDGPNPLTHTHQVMGTIHYMAPEQWEKPQTVDHRADIYSLGVVFYELLTGELPLGRFPLPSEKVQIDVRLDNVVLRTLEKEPDRRYQHAGDVKTDVERLTAEKFDQLTLEEAMAAGAKLKERQAELKATQRRLGQHVGTLIGEDIWHKFAKVGEDWRQMPSWKRNGFWILLALFTVLLPVSLVGSAMESPTGFSLANSSLVLAIFFVASTVNLLLVFTPRKQTNLLKHVSKIGCAWSAVNSIGTIVLLLVSLFSKNHSFRVVVNAILLANVFGQFAWQMVNWFRSRVHSGSRSDIRSLDADGPEPPRAQTDQPTEKHWKEAAAILLAIVGAIGLIGFLSFNATNGPDRLKFQIGQPDAWLTWNGPQEQGGLAFELSFLRWSMAIGIASIVALYYAVQWWPRNEAALGQTQSPAPLPDEPPGTAFKRALDVFVTPQPGFARWVGVPMLILTAVSMIAWGLATSSLDDKGAELTFYAVGIGLIITGLALTIHWAMRRSRQLNGSAIAAAASVAWWAIGLCILSMINALVPWIVPELKGLGQTAALIRWTILGALFVWTGAQVATSGIPLLRPCRVAGNIIVGTAMLIGSLVVIAGIPDALKASTTYQERYRAGLEIFAEPVRAWPGSYIAAALAAALITVALVDLRGYLASHSGLTSTQSLSGAANRSAWPIIAIAALLVAIASPIYFLFFSQPPVHQTQNPQTTPTRSGLPPEGLRKSLIGTWSSVANKNDGTEEPPGHIRHTTFNSNGKYVDWLANGTVIEGTFKWTAAGLERRHQDRQDLFTVQVTGNLLTFRSKTGDVVQMKRSEVGDAKTRLIGQWVWVNQVQNPGSTEYRTDGTFEERSSNGGVTTGEYRWVSDKEIEVKITGQSTRRVEIEFDGRRLYFHRDDGTVFECRRKD